MNVEQKLTAIRDVVQEDIGNRGLRRDPEANLINACPDDFANACRSLAGTANASVRVITGFIIPHAETPTAETDGPLGAIFLSRALVPLGIQVTLETDASCTRALELGLSECGLGGRVRVRALPSVDLSSQPTHLIALERCGPSHADDRYHTMRGLDVSHSMFHAEAFFEQIKLPGAPRVTTIGIGDGGNEIGMGKIPRDIIRRNVPGGDLIACRVATDYLIVAGVSNWGAYALATGVALLKGQRPDPRLFHVARERDILRVMVEQGPLVDGVTGKRTVTVDGLSFERYAEPLQRIGEIMTM